MFCLVLHYSSTTLYTSSSIFLYISALYQLTHLRDLSEASEQCQAAALPPSASFCEYFEPAHQPTLLCY
ncbi:hypothetical protein FPQ18DRAFT_398854 [Pyronema domesticum]|nr:hypothetical protein FPQ18DRAFT_398854 [Pyronema domesticum]